MQIKIEGILKNIVNGEPLKDEEGKILTLKWAFTQALLGTYQKESIDGNEKYARFKLATKIQESKESVIEISVEEVAKLKKLVGEAFPTMICGQIYASLGE